jgi:hypothetical protein
MRESSWWRENATILSVAVSTVLILFTFAAAWGELRAEIRGIDGRMDQLEGVVRTHHDDTDRHVDGSFKQAVRDQLAEIRRLVMEHMAASIPRRDGAK